MTYRDVVLYRRLVGQARPYWGHIAGLFVISLLATPIALLTPLALMLVVDNVLGDEPAPAWLPGTPSDM